VEDYTSSHYVNERKIELSANMSALKADGAKEYIKRTIPVRIKLEASITPTNQKAKKLTKTAIRKQDREKRQRMNSSGQ
jgi:hypothetical protein